MHQLNFSRKWIIAGLMLFLGCVSHIDRNGSLVLVQDGKYDSEYPGTPTSKALVSISKSVYQISSLTFYRQFYFNQGQQITRELILEKNIPLQPLAYFSQIVEKPTAGTGTVISYQNNRIVVLTCAHIISAPDTLIQFFRDSNGNETPFIERVNIKLRQSLNVIGLPVVDDLEVIAIDQEVDLALIGAKISIHPKKLPSVFNYPLGQSDELEMGVFVYLFGFPHGKKMVLSSIVSAPVNEKKYFIVNATMHNGISGGLVLALRDGVPHFELVGIINALSAFHQVVLRPEPGITAEDIMPSQPYSGNVYLVEQAQIIDGISFAIPAETIKSFLERQRKSLEGKSYFISTAFEN